MALVLRFQSFSALECALPAVIEGEGLGEGLANDVACLVGIEEFGVKRNDLDCEGGALGGELRIEGVQMKEDCLFGLEHLGCALAGNGDENDVFGFHIDRIFYLKTILVIGSSISVNSRIHFVGLEECTGRIGNPNKIYSHWWTKQKI